MQKMTSFSHRYIVSGLLKVKGISIGSLALGAKTSNTRKELREVKRLKEAVIALVALSLVLLIISFVLYFTIVGLHDKMILENYMREEGISL